MELIRSFDLGNKTANCEDLQFIISRIARQNKSIFLRLMRGFSFSESFHRLLSDPLLDSIFNDFKIKLPAVCSKIVLHVSGPYVTEHEVGHISVPPHQDLSQTKGSDNSLVIWTPLLGTDQADGALWLGKNDSNSILEHREHQVTNEIIDFEISDFSHQRVLVGDALVFDQKHPHFSITPAAPRLAVSLRIDDLSDPKWRERDFYHSHKYVVEK